ncbi:hypothetical protein [Bacillus atrophaeus]|uniref:hypothetical protein n=1 Tax=Bacillus atrophaeus TaxID=1452 RepID=UPI0022800095|nr:hypothetical protein [Bacillus atrophaeus]MCY8813632.1 hypothetical protein [Bacillus atrophaeus]MCY8820295.1 hypothetical protein [Bacillus atrophaeus]MCY8828581.1 hypothetical protein [Bacillus atrophaeus]MCY8832668.1 hypothetical protein [Bacillus atrophaeus]MEC0749798.1 hypothetical protein [Bacillus atrophaeus]
MAKAIKVAFSERAEDQQRLRQVGGSIVFSKGKPQFHFPSMDAYREWQRLGTEAYKRKVEAAQ